MDINIIFNQIEINRLIFMIFIGLYCGDNNILIMQDNTKKKKKYIKKKEDVEQSTNSYYKSNSILQQPKKVSLSRFTFDYNFQQLINLFLAKLLPDPNFTIKFSQKLIFGQQKSIDKKIAQMDQCLKYDQGFILQLEYNIQKQDIEFECNEDYRIKIYTFKLIDKCIGQYFIGTKYQRQYIQFKEIFQRKDCQRVFIRMKKIFVRQFLQKFQDKVRRMTDVQVSSKKIERGNRKNLRKQMSSITIPVEHIKIEAFKQFIQRSKKIDRKDIQIIETKSSFGKNISYTIKLNVYQQQKQLKLQGFNYYFKHQNFIPLPSKSTPYKDKVIEQYTKINTQWIKITYIKGYRSSKWDDKTTLYKIRCDQISKKKNNYTNVQFQAFLLIGLFPQVNQYLEKLGQIINQVPQDDKRRQLFIQFNNQIDVYLKSNRQLEQFLYNYITDYLQKYKHILTLLSIKFPSTTIKLNLLIKQQKQHQFQSQILHEIQVNMLKSIQLIKKQIDFQIDQQFINKLKLSNFIIVNYHNKQITYIQSNQNMVKSQNKFQEIIGQFQNYTQEYIYIVGKNKLKKYMEIIQIIKKEEHFQQVLVAQPFSEDKINFKIGFISARKKNSKLVQLVKERIKIIQASLDDYYQIIDKKAGEALIENNMEDLTKISQKNKIDIVVDNTGIIDAHLYFQPLERTRQIIFLKNTKLNKLPLGTTILINTKTHLQKLSQNYLQSFKLKAKRSTLNLLQPIKQIYKQKDLTFLFKEDMSLNEMLSKGLGIIGDSYDICIFMPTSKKQIFINQLIDNLKYNYAKMEYKIYVIELDQNVDLEEIIKIPQYQAKKYKLQWYCQGKVYNKSGNDKINDALAKGMESVVLSQQDLPRALRLATHIFNKSTHTIKCNMTSDIRHLKITPQTITFIHKNLPIQLTKYQQDLIRSYLLINSESFNISLPFYQISLIQNKQINIFTKQAKSITKQEISVGINKHADAVRIFYNQKCTQLIYSFQEKNTKMLIPCVQQINQFIRNLYQNVNIPLKNLKNLNILYQTIQNRAKQYQVSIKIHKNQLQIGTFNKNDLFRFKNIIQQQMNYLLKLQQIQSNTQNIKKCEIIYPQYWNLNNNKDIQSFLVDKNTIQFKEIQGLFTLRPIQNLFRLQNKILYKKYIEELAHLQFLNKGKVLQLKLFHGTNKTSPSVIWEDKEEGFNINYTSQNNLLGKAIYFAQKSQYSEGYKHSYTNALGQRIYSMFLCTVIIGDSQKMTMSVANSKVIDTQYKNNNLRYESIVGQHPICKIYTVYKNRRAYPLYLIQFK